MTDARLTPGYESPTLRLRPLVWSLVLLPIGVAVALAVPALWPASLASKRQVSGSTGTELSQPLQPSLGHRALPWEDMTRLHERQRQLLFIGSKEPDHPRLPIDKAMDQLLESGALKQPWTQPATQPWQRPREESTPTVENRT